MATNAEEGVNVAVLVLASYATAPETAFGSITWMFVVFTVEASAADENTILMGVFSATPVVPGAGVMLLTENAVEAEPLEPVGGFDGPLGFPGNG